MNYNGLYNDFQCPLSSSRIVDLYFFNLIRQQNKYSSLWNYYFIITSIIQTCWNFIGFSIAFDILIYFLMDAQRLKTI